MEKERELRGKFGSSAELSRFIDKMEKIKHSKEHRFRLSILFTRGNKKGLDMQLRMYNKSPELMLKIGKHSGNARRELAIKFDEKYFQNAVGMLVALGFKDGYIADCQDWLYNHKGAEIKVTSCDGNIFVWEIEALGKTPTSSLYKIALQLGLRPQTQKELSKYWNWMKRKANRKLKIGSFGRNYKNYLSKLA